MAGRQVFSEGEKRCLQELIVKYKINSHTPGTGNIAWKREAWARLTQEFNSVKMNVKRTEAQLKKLWDNLKTRRKRALAQEKRERMKTGGGHYIPMQSTSAQPEIDIAEVDCVNLEMEGVIDSDDSDIPHDIVEDTQIELENVDIAIQETELDVTESDVLASENLERPASLSLFKPNMGTSEKKKVKVEVVSEEENKMCLPCSEHSKVGRDERNDHFSALVKEELRHVLPCMRTRCYVKILNFLNSVIGCHIDQFQLSDTEVN